MNRVPIPDFAGPFLDRLTQSRQWRPSLWSLKERLEDATTDLEDATANMEDALNDMDVARIEYRRARVQFVKRVHNHERAVAKHDEIVRQIAAIEVASTDA